MGQGRAQRGHGAGQVSAHGAGSDAQHRRGSGHVEVEEQAQRDDLALAPGQRPQRGQQVRVARQAGGRPGAPAGLALSGIATNATFTQSGTNSTLDLGTFQQNSGTVDASLGLTNTGIANSDQLAGNFTTSGPSALEFSDAWSSSRSYGHVWRRPFAKKGSICLFSCNCWSRSGLMSVTT